MSEDIRGLGSGDLLGASVGFAMLQLLLATDIPAG
jgi:hypothetical protein